VSTTPDKSVSQADLAVAETIGQLMQFWGFKRPMGRLWTVLYLSPTPLGAADLGDRLKMSAGSVSMNLNELLKWGAIRRTWRPGERRDFYECETGIWKLVSRVLRERELALIRDASATLEQALENLDADPDGDSRDRDFKRTRIQTLHRLAKVGETLLASLDAGIPVSPDAIRAVADDPHEA
jgi:DNA-binding transcriptional regulator GbsR (MarR family)